MTTITPTYDNSLLKGKLPMLNPSNASNTNLLTNGTTIGAVTYLTNSHITFELDALYDISHYALSASGSAKIDFLSSNNSVIYFDSPTANTANYVVKELVLPIKDVKYIRVTNSSTNQIGITEINVWGKIILNKTLILQNGEYKQYSGGTRGRPLGTVDLVPKLTGFTGGGVTVSSDTSIAEVTANPVWKVFDDINDSVTSGSSGWLTGVRTNTWLKVDFGASKNIGGYSLSCFGTNFSSTTTGYMPKDWTIEGSNDDSNWELLDTKTNQSNWIYLEKRNYKFSNFKSYRYYRFNINNNNGENRIGLGEMEFFEAEIPSTPSSWSTVSSTTPTSTQFTEQGMDSLSPLLDRKVTKLELQAMTQDATWTEGGKVFKKSINLKKYFDIRSINVTN